MIKKLGNIAEHLAESFAGDGDFVYYRDLYREMLPYHVASIDGSWYQKSFGPTDWHTDQQGRYAMIIASWPTATEIVLGDFQSFEDVVTALECGEAEVFQPEPGDIYYLDKGTWHRPDTIHNGKRLCTRLWLMENVKWPS